MVAARVTAEKMRYRDENLTAINEKLKVLGQSLTFKYGLNNLHASTYIHGGYVNYCFHIQL